MSSLEKCLFRSSAHFSIVFFDVELYELFFFVKIVLAFGGLFVCVCFNFYFYFILLYNTVLVLPYIDMNQPQVYMSSQS